MTPSEFWLIYATKVKEINIGGMSVSEAERLLENLETAEQKWQKSAD